MPESKGDKGDLGQRQAQAKADEAQAKGHFGEKPGVFPNEAFSLQSGPDSPSAAEQSAAVLEERARGSRESAGVKR